jgi:FecR protein/Putative zinc-finger
MTNREFDRIMDAVRDDVPDPQTVRDAAARVRSRLEAEASEAAIGEADLSSSVEHLDSCADFQAVMPAYRSSRLSEARRLLVEDHLRSCVACRRVFREVTQGVRPAVIPITSKPSTATRVTRRAIPFAIAAAILAAMGATLPSVLDRVFAPSGPRATVASVDGGLYLVSEQGLMALSTGAPLNEHDEVRTAKGSRAVIELRDGSRIEMAERSGLTISERWSGKSIYLDRGSVMIEAAKQRRGRLEVITPDCAVSVKGTIFEVSRGIKGSRVSVVEGEVKVDEEGSTQLLHRGDQAATNVSVSNISVAQDVAWSANATKYLALLGELSAIEKRIEAIPSPGLRYQSKLAGLLPENTAIFASVPNLAPVLAEANGIFEERVDQSPVLREWWNQNETQQLRAIVGQVQGIGAYLGDEVVLAVPSVNGKIQEPIVIAEVVRPGLAAFLEQQFGLRNMSGNPGVSLLAAPSSTGPGPRPVRPSVIIRGNAVTMSSLDTLTRMARAIDAGKSGGFLSTPLGSRVSKSYRAGIGWIFAADMEQIAGGHVLPQVKGVKDAAQMPISGLDNVRYLVIERKENLGRTENSASLSFSGARHGLMSWLAAPGPMGTLDFVSPEASFAASFVVKNPGTLLQELIGLSGTETGPAAVITEFQNQTGVNLLNDVAANLGGEMTVAFDGPLLPTPSWKIALEVDNPARLEWAFEQALKTAQQNAPGGSPSVQLETLQVNGMTGHALKSPQLPFEIDYVFTDGYLLIGSSQTVLEAAIESRTSGLTLARSAAFRTQLPQDGHVNFSGLLYYNMGSMAGPVVDQLRAGGLMTPEQQKLAGQLTSNRAPGLIYAFGEPDRITVGSRGGFFGLNLDTLLGLNAKGAAALPQLLPLNFISAGTGSRKREATRPN